MSLLDLVPATAVAVVGFTILAMPVLRLTGLMTILVLARTFSDVGIGSTGGPLLPAAALNAALGAVLVGLLFVPTERRLPPSLRAVLTVAALLALLGTVVGLLNFGLAGGSLQEALRLVSVAAVFVIGTRLPYDNASAGRQFAWLAAVPAVVLIVGFLGSLAPTLLVNGRAAGSFSHSNTAAAYFAVASLACLAWWLRRHDVRLVGAGLLSLVALAMTSSLGGLAALAAASLVLVLLSRRLSAGRIAPLVAILLLAWTVTIFSRVREALSKLLQGSSASEKGDSLAWRLLNWRLLLERWHEHPWLGFGLGSTRTMITPLGAPPHSLPLQVLVETGVVGVVTLVVLLVVLVRLIAKHARTQRAAAVFAVSLLVFAVVNGVESNLLGYTSALYLLALVVGRAYAAQRRSSAFRDAAALTLKSEDPDRVAGRSIPGRPVRSLARPRRAHI